MDSQRKAVSVIEAAKMLGIGKNLAYQAVDRGELPTIKIGGRILVPLAALEKMLEGGVSASAAD